MYLKPLSTASVTTTASGPSCSASRRAATTFAPDEMPAKIPSSCARRSVISIASSSSIVQISSTREASQCGGTMPVHPCIANDPCGPPVIAADPAGSSPTTWTPRGRSATETPMSDPAVPIPWQKAVTRPLDHPPDVLRSNTAPPFDGLEHLELGAERAHELEPLLGEAVGDDDAQP